MTIVLHKFHNVPEVIKLCDRLTFSSPFLWLSFTLSLNLSLYFSASFSVSVFSHPHVSLFFLFSLFSSCRLAKKSFTGYLRSLQLMPGKHQQDVTKLPLEAFAISLGLGMTPEVPIAPQGKEEREEVREKKNVNRLVCLCVCVCVCLSVCLSVYLAVFKSHFMSARQSIYLSGWLFPWLPICLSLSISLSLSVSLSLSLYLCLYLCLSISVSVCLSISVSLSLSSSLYLYLSFRQLIDKLRNCLFIFFFNEQKPKYMSKLFLL